MVFFFMKVNYFFLRCLDEKKIHLILIKFTVNNIYF